MNCAMPLGDPGVMVTGLDGGSPATELVTLVVALLVTARNVEHNDSPIHNYSLGPLSHFMIIAYLASGYLLSIGRGGNSRYQMICMAAAATPCPAHKGGSPSLRGTGLELGDPSGDAFTLVGLGSPWSRRCELCSWDHGVG